MSRASTLYASAYETERMHEVRIRKGAVRPIRVELNGLLPVGITVSSVTWDTSCQSVVSLGMPTTLDRSFSAWLTGVCEGNGEIEAKAIMSDGSVSVQRISVRVQ